MRTLAITHIGLHTPNTDRGNHSNQGRERMRRPTWGSPFWVQSRADDTKIETLSPLILALNFSFRHWGIYWCELILIYIYIIYCLTTYFHNSLFTFVYWFPPCCIYNITVMIHKIKDQEHYPDLVWTSLYRTISMRSLTTFFLFGPQSPRHIVFITNDAYATSHHHWSG